LLDSAEFLADTRQYGASVARNVIAIAAAQRAAAHSEDVDALGRLDYFNWKAMFASGALGPALALGLKMLARSEKHRTHLRVAHRCLAATSFLRGDLLGARDHGTAGLDNQLDAYSADWLDEIEVRVTTAAYLALSQLFLGATASCLASSAEMVLI